MRLIDADAITNSNELATKIISLNLTPYIEVDDLLDFIDKLPTIEATPVVERDKVIDEFAEEMKRYIAVEYGLTDISLRDIDRIAEQMKGGAE